MPTKEELREELDKLGAEQPPADAKKEELEQAVADASSSDGDDSDATVGADSEASDPDKVADDLSPEGQEALAEVGADSEYAEQSDLALDASGPLHFESPSEREMTGAVNEAHAKEQEELLKDKPEDFAGYVTEAGFADSGEQRGTLKDNLGEGDDREVYEVRQEDVIDFPPPLGEEGDKQTVLNEAPSGPFANTTVAGGQDRVYNQKGVFYTDGLSGAADQNLERAYEIPELLQTNDPAARAAGDESLSEAAKEEKSEEEADLADTVKTRDE